MPSFNISGLTTAGQTLDAGQSGQVLLNGSLVTSSVAVDMTANSTSLTNRGTIISQNQVGISSDSIGIAIINAGFISSELAMIFNDNNAVGTVTVINTGVMAASSTSAEGVYLSASGGLRLTNSGTISTLGDSAVRVEQGGIFETNIIFNSGLIQNLDGLSFQMDNDADTITNTGTIIGDMQLGGGANQLRNSGQIEGDVTAGAGVDVIDLRGGFVSGLVNTGGGSDTLTGGALDDRLVGDDGADLINTGAGDDAANGGDDNDTMSGGTGNDVLAGGLGVDRMAGGAGADVFDYNTVNTSITGARDVITDFLRGTDDIDLATIDARAGLGGNQAFVFIGAAAFSAEGQVRIIDQGANVVVQANRSGGLAADFEVMVLGVGTLTAADFIL